MKQRIYLLAAAITAIVIASATAAPAQGLPEGLAGTPSRISATGQGNEIIIIDSRVATKDELQAIKAEQIKEFSALKMGDSRLIDVKTYKGSMGRENAAPVILVNGLEIDSLQQVRQEYIQSAKSLQPDEAVATYGERGSYGAVMITMLQTYNGKPVSLRDALSGSDKSDPSHITPPGKLEVIGIKAHRKEDASEAEVGKRSPAPEKAATPAKAAKPLTLGRPDNSEETYLIPDINKIKPEDIASVMVIHQKSAHLFDAYGDTSGGVILITFKKGRMPLSDVVKAEKK